jgi:hypothetical protein
VEDGQLSLAGTVEQIRDLGPEDQRKKNGNGSSKSFVAGSIDVAGRLAAMRLEANP